MKGNWGNNAYSACYESVQRREVCGCCFWDQSFLRPVLYTVRLGCQWREIPMQVFALRYLPIKVQVFEQYDEEAA
jgi:hypothetical protein